MSQPVPVFAGTVTSGKVIWEHPADVSRWTRGLEGKRVGVRIAEFEDERSAALNAYLWGPVYDAIADYTGDDKLAIHEFMKAKFLGTREMRIVNHETGEIEERVVPGTSRTTTKKFCWFVEQIRAFAGSFMGLVIEDPDPALRSTRRRKKAA